MTAAIHHLVLADEWARVVESGGPYRGSTRDRSLADEGFIHCSFAHQVVATADRYYADGPDVVVLTIDPQRVDAPIEVEAAGGGRDSFPHIYGPLPLEAVTAVEPLDAFRRAQRNESGGHDGSS